VYAHDLQLIERIIAEAVISDAQGMFKPF